MNQLARINSTDRLYNKDGTPLYFDMPADTKIA